MTVLTDDGVSLELSSAGEGSAVVLLHGLTATRRYVLMGSRLLERAGHRVIAYDARGHGRSAPARSARGYEYRRLADDLLCVLDALELEKAMLVGASMGAHTILAFALQHPRRASALAVITPAYLPQSEGSPHRAAELARWDALAAGLRCGGPDGFLAAYDLSALPERWRSTVQRVILQRLAAHEHPEAVADALEVVPRSAPFADLGALRAIGVPAVLIASRDEADPGHPLEVAERYAEAMPGSKLHVEQPGSSPLPWQGGQVSRILLEMAAALDAQAGR